jgi:putative ABC transport system substrate-binding protein
MKRREFLAFLGGAAIAWPRAASGQQPGERVRRIGVLMMFAADDLEGQTRIPHFMQALEKMGWAEGRNLQIDIRWTAGNIELARRYAAELVSLAPDAILAATTPMVEVMQQATATVPIVFVTVTDPVGAGLVASLARPGGKYNRIWPFRFRHQSEMVRATQRNCATRETGGDPSGSKSPLWDPRIGRAAVHRAIIRGGVVPN